MGRYPLLSLPTWAAGLVGQNLVTLLSGRADLMLVAIDKHAHNLGVLAGLHPGVTAVQADLADPGSWRDHFDGADSVVQLHAQITGRGAEPFVRNNVTGRSRLALRAADVGIKLSAREDIPSCSATGEIRAGCRSPLVQPARCTTASSDSQLRRLRQSGGVRYAGRVSLGSCQPNRQQPSCRQQSGHQRRDARPREDGSATRPGPLPLFLGISLQVGISLLLLQYLVQFSPTVPGRVSGRPTRRMPDD